MTSGRFQVIKCQWHCRQDPILLLRSSHNTLFGAARRSSEVGYLREHAPALLGIKLGQLWLGWGVAIEETPKQALQPQ